MAGPITNFVENVLLLNDKYVTEPLFDNQQKPWIGTFPAVLQVAASTITAAVAGIFALLASVLGLICKGIGFKAAGNDLIQSADTAIFNATPTGALFHLLLAGFSLANAVSLTKLARSSIFSLT